MVADYVEIVEDTEGAHSGSHSRIAAGGADGDTRQRAERLVDLAAAAAAVADSDSVEGKCRMAAPGASHRDMSWHLSIGEWSLSLRVAAGVDKFVHRRWELRAIGVGLLRYWANVTDDGR